VPSQSASDVQAVLHAVALAQTKPPGQAVGLPATQVPEPLQALVVIWPPPHEAVPQLVPLVGNTHAPPALQSVAPQAPPDGLHVEVQQWVPAPPCATVPQAPLRH
jgi:hypothetical protein